MIDIWQECAKFQTSSQKLADLVRTIIKKGWFSDLEILEIHQNIHKQNYNTVPETSSGVKEKQSNGYSTKQPGRKTIIRTKDKSRKSKEYHE